MKAFLTSAALAVALSATAAAAAPTFDPVNDFGATPVNFRYGYTVGGTFTAGTYQTSGCAIGGTSCYAQANFHGVYFAPNDGTYQGAELSSSEVTLHPGPGSDELATVRFVAPTTGSYLFSGYFRAADIPSGDGTTVSTPDGSSALGVRGTQNVAFSFRQSLTQGGTADFSVGNGGGGYSFDTTGLSLQIAAVPEPATWAFMILGFGFVGGAMRYRGTGHRVAVPA